MCCHDCGLGWQLQLQFDHSLGTSICCRRGPKKKKKKRKIEKTAMIRSLDKVRPHCTNPTPLTYHQVPSAPSSASSSVKWGNRPHLIGCFCGIKKVGKAQAQCLAQSRQSGSSHDCYRELRWRENISYQLGRELPRGEETS